MLIDTRISYSAWHQQPRPALGGAPTSGAGACRMGQLRRCAPPPGAVFQRAHPACIAAQSLGVTMTGLMCHTAVHVLVLLGQKQLQAQHRISVCTRRSACVPLCPANGASDTLRIAQVERHDRQALNHVTREQTVCASKGKARGLVSCKRTRLQMENTGPHVRHSTPHNTHSQASATSTASWALSTLRHPARTL